MFHMLKINLNAILVLPSMGFCFIFCIFGSYITYTEIKLE